MRNAALRARIERILKGDVRVDDLITIFMDTRFQCGSQILVRDVADFIAHKEGRNQGAAFGHVRDWALMWDFYVWTDGRPKGLPVDLSIRPSNYDQFLKASLRQMSEAVLQTKTGLTLSEGRKLLGGILKKFTQNSDGTLNFAFQHTQDEYQLMAALSTIISLTSLMTDDSLFDDLAKVLRRIGVLKKDEIATLSNAKAAIALFAMSRMHNVTIEIADVSTSVDLKLNAGGKSIFVNATGPLPWRVFESGLVAADHCEAELLAVNQPWDCEIELSPQMKLARLA